MEKLNNIIEKISKNYEKGIIRKLDELGRVVIPIEYRSENIKGEKKYVEVYQIGSYAVVEVLEGKFEKKRKFDELGRIVINVEIRNRLNWVEKDKIEIWNYNKYFILKKVEKECVFCYSKKNLTEFRGKNLCQKCKEKLLNDTMK